MTTILTPNQQIALKAISGSELAKMFYFSGGTALSHYYLQHRFSEDLDYFKEEEFEHACLRRQAPAGYPKI